MTISGVVVYEEFNGGEVLLTLAEGISSRCSGPTAVQMQTPGVQIAETTLAELGAFSISGTVCWADSAPDLELLGYLRPTGQPNGPSEAGGYVSLRPESQSDVTVTLTKGYYPGRE